MTRLVLAVFALAGLTLGSGPAHADIFDEANITVDTYTVSGASLAEVQDQMSSDGPRGFWAYTTWNVTWTAACETTVTASITLPELDDTADLTEDEVAEFDRMRDALSAHELHHVSFGTGFADQVRDAGCPAKSDAILQRWLQKERDFDAETEHGRTQGVYLEDM